MNGEKHVIGPIAGHWAFNAGSKGQHIIAEIVRNKTGTKRSPTQKRA